MIITMITALNILSPLRKIQMALLSIQALEKSHLRAKILTSLVPLAAIFLSLMLALLPALTLNHLRTGAAIGPLSLKAQALITIIVCLKMKLLLLMNLMAPLFARSLVSLSSYVGQVMLSLRKISPFTLILKTLLLLREEITAVELLFRKMFLKRLSKKMALLLKLTTNIKLRSKHDYFGLLSFSS